MFELRKFRRLFLARLAGMALLSAACVTHFNKPAPDPAAHALGAAGHAAPPGLQRVILAPPAAGAR
jgi:hypothetical protein